MPETMMRARSIPSTRYSRLFPVLMAAIPTPKVMRMKYLPSRVTRKRRGVRRRERSLVGNRKRVRWGLEGGGTMGWGGIIGEWVRGR